MRVVAILATYNEERFIAPCLENLFRQGIQAYLIDNDSTDETVAIARHYLGRGLLGVENFPRDGVYRWSAILRRKEQLAATLEADWFMHVDADEVYPSPRPGITVADIFAEAEGQGYNAVNFMHCVFIPTIEAPEHDHPQFLETMRWYYPFMPAFPNLVRAWKRQPVPVELAWSGGHLVNFPGRRLYPQTLPMRHYLFLSVPHAIRKYTLKQYDPAEVKKGWHNWRATLRPDMIKLPPQAEMNTYVSDEQFDVSNPRTRHCFFDEAVTGEINPRRRRRSLTSRFEGVTASRGWRLLSRCGRIMRSAFSSVYRQLSRAALKTENKDG
jgi:glycosyltransferase involved in cell wall biosynthesis